MLIREQFQELEGVIDLIYDKEMKKRTDYRSKIYNVDNSKKAEEKHHGIGSIGLMKEWNGTVNYDSIDKGYMTTYRHKKYSNGIQVERELLDDKEYIEIKKRTRKLAYSVYLTQQQHGASTFNNAFDTGITGADGKPLCALETAGHPFSPKNTTDTQYNALKGLELTTKNIEKVRSIMIEWTDDRGNILGVNPDGILVGNYYDNDCKKILATSKEPFTAENTKNIWEGEFKRIYCPWIKGKKWFMVDTLLMDNYLNWYNRRIPKIEYVDDFDTEVGKYKVVGRWSYGWDSWEFIFGLLND